MKKSRIWVIASLLCTFRIDVVYGLQCDTSGDRYACFRYDLSPIFQQDLAKSQKMEWMSYKRLFEHSNVFGSLDDFSGQYIPKNSFGFLGIANTRAILILGDIRDFLRVKFPFHIGLYVDTKMADEKGDLLSFYSFEGAMIGNIVVANSLLHSSKKN